MCLKLIEKTKATKAKKDIYTWKLVKEIYPGQFISPFRKDDAITYNLGKLYISKLDKVKFFLKYPIFTKIDNVYLGLHTVYNYDGALQLKKELMEESSIYDYKILQAIVPKGAYYYVGDFYGITSLVSNKLKIV